MRKHVRACAGVLAAAGMVTGSMAVAGARPAVAAPICHGKPVTMIIEEHRDDQVNYGTQGDDVVLLKGTWWHTFYAKGGDDTVCVGGVGAEVHGGKGDDWISGQKASERVSIHGGPGDDTLTSSDYDDFGWGNELYGGAGRDVIHGGAGSDDIYPDGHFWEKVDWDAPDIVHGNGGSDVVNVTMFPASKTSGPDELSAGADGGTLSVEGVPSTVNLSRHRLQATSGGPVDRIRGFRSVHTKAEADVVGGPGENFVSVSGPDTTVDTLGGDDRVAIAGKNATVRTGDGDDEVNYSSYGKRNRVWLGAGDDRIQLEGSKGVKVSGGRGDDRFDILGHGELGEGEGEHDDLFPMRATLLGKSGTDTLTWDCKSTVKVEAGRLNCTHKLAKITFGGMQIYKAGRYLRWKDVFHGSSGRDVFYGRGNDDVMYGHGGKDELIGGKGYDVARGGKGKDSCRAERKYSC